MRIFYVLLIHSSSFLTFSVFLKWSKIIVSVTSNLQFDDLCHSFQFIIYFSLISTIWFIANTRIITRKELLKVQLILSLLLLFCFFLTFILFTDFIDPFDLSIKFCVLFINRLFVKIFLLFALKGLHIVFKLFFRCHGSNFIMLYCEFKYCVFNNAL